MEIGPENNSSEASPAIEGVVLDAEGHTLYTPKGPRISAGAEGTRSGRAQIRVYSGGWWLPLALGVGIPLLFVAGIFIFTLLMTVGLAFLLLRSVFGFGRPLRSR